MQNKVKIIFVLIFFIFISCNKKQVYLKFENLDTDKLVFIDDKTVKNIKDNLYIISDTIYIGITYFEPRVKKRDIIEMHSKGMILFNVKKYNYDIDVKSYQWLIEELISKDKNNVYAFPRKYHLSSPKMLKLNPSKVMICDKSNTYLKDEKYVYCIPSDTYLNIESSNFAILDSNNVVYGKNKITGDTYYLNEINKRE